MSTRENIRLIARSPSYFELALDDEKHKLF